VKLTEDDDLCEKLTENDLCEINWR
jgi:hypothetical protein